MQTGWVHDLDNVLFAALEHLLDDPLDDVRRLRATLRLSDGGCAFPSAAQTAPAAYAASWALCLHDVAACLGVSTLEELRARCPRTLQAFAQAEQALRAAGSLGGETLNLLEYMREPQHKRQGHWGKAASGASQKRLLDTLLDEDGRLSLRSAGGTGAGSFLLPRHAGDAAQPDKHFLTNLKMRLDMPVCPEGARCQHKNATTGQPCNHPLDRKGWHARKCEVGGSRNDRHNRLRDFHAKRHTELTGYAAPTEQHVPGWDRRLPNGTVEEAKLDVATVDHNTGRHIYVDWAVTCAHSTYAPRRHARSNRSGLAAAQRVDDKRARYPPRQGLELIPMVFEAGGRPSEEAAAFVRSYGANLEDDERGELLSRLWRDISVTLHTGNAEMVLSALGR